MSLITTDSQLIEALMPEVSKTDESSGSLVVQILPVVQASYHIEEAHRSSDEVEGVPAAILELYAEIACRHARVEEIEPGGWLASVAGLDGAYGEGDSPDEARADLKEAIVGWVVVKRRIGATDIAPMEGLDLNPLGESNGETSQGHEAA